MWFILPACGLLTTLLLTPLVSELSVVLLPLANCLVPPTPFPLLLRQPFKFPNWRCHYSSFATGSVTFLLAATCFA